jgi:hypothetical protein
LLATALSFLPFFSASDVNNGTKDDYAFILFLLSEKMSYIIVYA